MSINALTNVNKWNLVKCYLHFFTVANVSSFIIIYYYYFYFVFYFYHTSRLFIYSFILMGLWHHVGSLAIWSYTHFKPNVQINTTLELLAPLAWTEASGLLAN